jgi:thiosulfate/3-mercaptopyruvate sulfurtransferase
MMSVVIDRPHQTHKEPAAVILSPSSLSLAAISLVAVLSGATRASDTYPRGRLLVEPAELANSAAAGEFVILDARKRDEYERGHVPGARHVDHDAWKSAFGQDESPAWWSDRIGGLGIDSKSTVVLYDDNGTKDAARIWWILRYWGVEDARLLNGGWTGWVAADLPTTEKTPPVVAASDFQATPHAARLATMDQVLRSLDGRRWQIVDARSEDEYCGVDKRDNARGGAIPGAKQLEWSDLIDQQTQRFKRPAEMRRLFEQAGIDLDRPTASHCNGGGRAAVMAFGLELMGADQVRNYYRGWGEWGNAENTPIQLPDGP